MEQYLSLLLLLGSAVLISAAPVWDDFSSITPMFALSVHTERNTTGHWISTINTTTSLRQGKPVKIDVDIVQGLGSCNGSELLQLVGTATVYSPLQGGTTKELEEIPCPQIHDMSKQVLTERKKGPPLGYNETDGINYYKFYPVKKSWEDANEICTGEGAHLIVFNSDNEVELFKNMVANKTAHFLSSGIHTAHIGITDKEDEGHFVSVFGDPVYTSSLTNWSAGQPEGGTLENCVVAGFKAQLYSIVCSTQRFFICEWESSL